MLAASRGQLVLGAEADAWWQAVGAEAQLAYFERVYTQAERFAKKGLGEFCVEAEALFHVMRRSFAQQHRRAILVDVGANTGNALAAMCGTFADYKQGPLALWAFEPNPESYASLKSGLYSKGGLGQFHQIHLMQAAVSDQRGTATFFHRGGGDVLAGLAKHPDRHLMNNGRQEDIETTVDVVALDEVFGPRVRIHLLKIDAEGYDPMVLRGARRLLRARRVKFVVFEYDVVWRTSGHNLTLRAATEELHALGYSCFLMMKAALLPLSGRWWQKVYDSVEWGNIFCGHSHDHDLFDAYLAHGSSNNYTLAFALTSLRSSASRALHWVP